MNFAVILNYKNYSQTIVAVNRLLKTSLDKIIVVDNDSPNESYSVLIDNFSNNDRVDIVQSPTNNGYAQGNNFGVQHINLQLTSASNSVVFILNPDIKIADSSIKCCSRFLLDTPQAGVVAPLMNGTTKNGWHHMTPRNVFFYQSWIFRWIVGKFGVREGGYYSLVDGRRPIPVDVVSGACFAVRLDTFNKVQGFDPGTFMYYEEEALYARMNRLGFQNYLLPECSFEHIGGGSTSFSKLKFKKINDRSRTFVLSNYYHIGKVYHLWIALTQFIDNSLIRFLRR
jgi:N-acetylglucosaminyl-diphospho-decaprenol L-rhamnosyltransferase